MGLHDEAKLDARMLDLIKLLVVEAQKRYHKKTALSNLDVRHEQLRMLVRLAYELSYFQFRDGAKSDHLPAALAKRRYLAISRHIDELGRMVGGWQAHVAGQG